MVNLRHNGARAGAHNEFHYVTPVTFVPRWRYPYGCVALYSIIVHGSALGAKAAATTWQWCRAPLRQRAQADGPCVASCRVDSCRPCAFCYRSCPRRRKLLYRQRLARRRIVDALSVGHETASLRAGLDSGLWSRVQDGLHFIGSGHHVLQSTGRTRQRSDRRRVQGLVCVYGRSASAYRTGVLVPTAQSLR